MVLPLLTAAALCGQIPERSVGVSATGLVHVGSSAPIAGLTLEGTIALRRDLALYVLVPIIGVPRQARVPNAPVVATDWASGASGGVRWVPLDGPVRPWAGLHLSNLNVFKPGTLGRTNVNVFAGAGLATGVDLAAPGFTLGVRAAWDALVDLGPFNQVRHHVGLALTSAIAF